jgi:PKD repeat protein
MKIKKILAIIVLFLFVVNSATFLITAQPEADENNNVDEFEYPVYTFPPKSEFALSLIDPNPEPPMSFDDLPNQFSWLDYGGDWTTPAKDQGSCGSCWAFGALGGLDAGINIASGYPNLDIDLSEQYILSCLPAAGSCGGGWMSEAIAYIQSDSPGSMGNGINGVPKESCLPYQAVDWIPCSDKCEDWDYFTVPPGEDNMLWQVLDYGVTTISEDDPNGWNLLKTWCITYGPVIVDIYTGGWSGFWSSHHDPNEVYQNDDSGITNHAQVLCGWVDDPQILNGGYWILKNSWGTGWGYGGFSNIAYGCNSLGTRDDTWVTAMPWPQGSGGPGPVDYDLAVFSNFDYATYDGSQYPHPGDSIVFTDTSDGDVVLREWDFNGDGTVDSTVKRPTHIYSNEGEYEVTLTVHSGWGIQSTRTKIIEVKEKWPPIVEIPSEFVGNSLTYSFDARYSYDPDKGTIVDYLWDFDDGTTSDEPYTTHTFPQPDKVYDVKLTLTDNDGAKASKICKVYIDQSVPPETEIIRGIGSLDPEWYSETQRLSFEATDWTGVVDTFYRVDGGNWERYVRSEQEYIPVGTEGEHIVEAYSVDFYGNEETPVSDIFHIDKSEPTLDVNVIGGEQIDGWYTDTVTIGIQGNDELSGVDKIMYQLDLGAWEEYTNPITIGEGSHYFNALIVDKAGNTNEDSAQAKIDLSAPESTCILIGQGTDNRFYKDVEIRIVGSDQGSGVKETYYRMDNAPAGYNTYYQPITADTLGKHTIEYYSIDNIGNQEPSKTTTFTISNVNFDLAITNPTNGLYIFGMRLLPIQKTILIGTAEIQANIQSFTPEPANIDHVDFLLDGEVQQTLTQSPYNWNIEQKITGTHTIQIKAYTPDGEIITDQITATLLII